jgi:hypothetical protein
MIRHIEVGGKKLAVHYGMNVIAQFSEMRSVSIDDALALDTSNMNLMDYMTLIYLGVKDGARLEKCKCEFASVDEFLDFADDNTEVIAKVAEVFRDYGKEKKEAGKKK